jgi:nitroreductase
MQAIETILSKRDSRSYKDTEISEETLREILQAGRMSGSSKNTQPWAFVVLRAAERKAELAACGQFAQHVPNAPLVIAVVLASNGGDFDAGRAAQNMMLAAWANGVTSCPVAMHDLECAARALDLPEGHRVAMIISFGYPESEESRHRGVPRTPLDELVHNERW